MEFCHGSILLKLFGCFMVECFMLSHVWPRTTRTELVSNWHSMTGVENISRSAFSRSHSQVLKPSMKIRELRGGFDDWVDV